MSVDWLFCGERTQETYGVPRSAMSRFIFLSPKNAAVWRQTHKTPEKKLLQMHNYSPLYLALRSLSIALVYPQSGTTE